MSRTLYSASLAACLLGLAPSAAVAAGNIDRPEAVKLDPDYEAGKKAWDAKDWDGAIKSLTLAAQHDPNNADIQNLLGYSYRKKRNMDLAFKYYGRALELDPNHRGAHEYVGVAYLMVDDLPKAEEHLAALNKLCFLPCSEYRDLKQAVADYKQRKANPQQSERTNQSDPY
jgi:Flp pilus assembly protein TadD